MNQFDLLKSHIEAFTRKDGAVVAAHDDARASAMPKQSDHASKTIDWAYSTHKTAVDASKEAKNKGDYFSHVNAMHAHGHAQAAAEGTIWHLKNFPLSNKFANDAQLSQVQKFHEQHGKEQKHHSRAVDRLGKDMPYEDTHEAPKG